MLPAPDLTFETYLETDGLNMQVKLDNLGEISALNLTSSEASPMRGATTKTFDGIESNKMVRSYSWMGQVE